MKCAPQWFIPNHFNPSLQMSKGRHKGKIQLSTGLPTNMTHPNIEALKKNQLETLAKTLSAAYFDSTFLKHTAQILIFKMLRTEREEGA